ncbi:hypothetical protein [Streptomyces sp. NPDC096351]|uniref:hypothetical protein n=1 Tax=Streptomyces sp. NPDC096351 TaxID=3366087 RepID=UPI00380BDE5E
MSEWGIALIAAGSAILGSIVTGFFAWKAGHRQAAAAEAAGREQAAALISTVQATLDEQRHARADERRRQAYATLLTAAYDYQLSVDNSLNGQMLAAIDGVEIEGPEEVAQAALRYGTAVNDFRQDRSMGVAGLAAARSHFIKTARKTLDKASP